MRTLQAGFSKATLVATLSFLMIGCECGPMGVTDSGVVADAGPDGGATDAGPDPEDDGGCLASLQLGVEHEIGELREGPATGSQVSAAIARGDNQWLVVWEDRRRNEGGDIFGARLGADGTVLDAHGLPISIVGGTQERPRVAFGAGLYLAVWFDYGTSEVRAARINPSGVVLDPDGFTVAGGHDPDVAFDGARFIVVFDGAGGVLATRVTTAGTIMDPGGVPIAAGASPSIAAGPSGTLLVSFALGDGTLEAGRISSDLALLDGDGFAVGSLGSQEPARIVFDAQRWWVAWTSGQSTNTAVLVRRFEPDGTPTDPQPLSAAAPLGKQGGASIGFDGDRVIVAWHEQTNAADPMAFDVRASRFALDGGALDAAPIALSALPGQQARPVIAAQPGAPTLIAWDGISDEPWDVFGTELAADGTVASPGGKRITSSANAQQQPTVGANGDGQLLAFVTRRGNRQLVAGQRLDGRGAPANTTDLELTADGLVYGHPDFAAGDPGLLTVMRWNETLDLAEIAATRIGVTGGPTDPQGLLLVGQPRLQRNPVVAPGPDGFLAVWEDDRAPYEYGTVFGARVTREGTVLDPGGFLLGRAVQGEAAPAIAFGAGVFLVAWYRFDTPNYDVGTQIDFAVVSPQGQVMSRGTLGSPDPKRDKTNPKVAFDGTNFLIAYELHLYTGWNVHASRVTPQGTVLDPTGIAISLSTVQDDVLLIHPSVVFASGSYVIGWQDEYLTRTEVRRLAPDGTLLDAAPLVVSSGALGQQALSLGVTKAGDVTAAYERYVREAGTWRVFERRLPLSRLCR